MEVFFSCQHKHNGSLTLRYREESDGCLALVDTSQVAALLCQEQQALHSWLSNEEKKYLQRFRFPKRHNEWLSGRIAAKCCLLQAATRNHSRQRPGEFSILPDPHGRPVLSAAPTGSRTNLSISHSRQYAVAMSANQACGVDIQHIGTQILKVQDRIATAEELALVENLHPGNREAGLTMLWAVKEAVKKHRLPDQPGIFQAIAIEQVSPGSKERSWTAECRLSANNQRQTVQIVYLDHYVLAWCLG